MALSLQSRINEAGRKLDRLRQRLESLRSRVETLETENAELTAENRRLREELTASQTDAEYLKLSHRLAENPDDLILMRQRVEAMIRDIDRCISQLKE